MLLNLTCRGFDIQRFIPNLLIASFFKIIEQRGGHAVEGKETNLSASFLEFSQIFPHFTLMLTQGEKLCRPVFTMCGTVSLDN